MHTAIVVLLGVGMGQFPADRVFPPAGAIECPPGTSPKGEVPVDNLNAWCVDEHGVKQGPELSWFSFPGAKIGHNGLELQGQNKDGKKTGCWTGYFPDGSVHSKRCYADDVNDGAFQRTFEDGKVEELATYRRGKLVGEQQLYFRNGQVYRAATYDDGKPTGTWRWFHRNGSKARELSFKNGLRDGETREWHDNGAVRAQGAFKAGRRDGPWIEWSVDATEVTRIRFVDGCPAGSRPKSKQDARIVESWCEDGSGHEQGVSESIGTGAALPFESALYVDGAKHGWATTWSDAGFLSAEVMYLRGKREGAYREWFDDDVDCVVGQYRDGKRTGPWRGFNWNGTPMFTGGYVDGKRDGKWSGSYMYGASIGGVFDHGRLVSGTDVIERMGIPEGEASQGP